MLIQNHAPKNAPPKRYALFLALTYLGLTCIYMFISTKWLTSLSDGSIERFAQMAFIKGCCFMLLTAIAFYASMRWVTKKAAESAIELHQTQERWLEAERQAAPALLASVIAHDLANLLTVLRLSVEKMKRIPELPIPAEDAIAKFDRGTQRLTDLVKRLRGASLSLFNEEPQNFDFTKCVSETLSLMQSHVCCENATIELTGDKAVSVRGYTVLVHQLVMNLLINAAEATDRKGHIRFNVTNADGGVMLTVDDNGTGIAPSLRERVMNAFFTTKQTGSGLGLTSVRSCVEIHKGTMQITDSPDLGGARFEIWFPDLSDERIEDLRHPERPQGHWYAVPEAEVPMAPVDSIRT